MLSMLMKGCFWSLSRSRSPFRSQMLVRALLPPGCAVRAAPCPHQVFLLGPIWLLLRELDALQGHVQEQDLSVSKEHEIRVLLVEREPILYIFSPPSQAVPLSPSVWERTPTNFLLGHILAGQGLRYGVGTEPGGGRAHPPRRGHCFPTPSRLVLGARTGSVNSRAFLRDFL